MRRWNFWLPPLRQALRPLGARLLPLFFEVLIRSDKTLNPITRVLRGNLIGETMDTIDEFAGPDTPLQFDRPPLIEIDVPPGDYRAWLVATDLPTAVGEAGPSACAFCIENDDGSLVVTQVLRGRPQKSSEQKAFIACLLAVLERIPAGSDIVIYCRSPLIVNAINGLLIKWQNEGRLHGKDAVAYAPLWRRVLTRRAEQATIRAETIETDDIKGNQIMDDLMSRARKARPDPS
jgi:ribonuclease HI